MPRMYCTIQAAHFTSRTRYIFCQNHIHRLIHRSLRLRSIIILPSGADFKASLFHYSEWNDNNGLVIYIGKQELVTTPEPEQLLLGYQGARLRYGLSFESWSLIDRSQLVWIGVIASKVDDNAYLPMHGRQNVDKANDRHQQLFIPFTLNTSYITILPVGQSLSARKTAAMSWPMTMLGPDKLESRL